MAEETPTTPLEVFLEDGHGLHPELRALVAAAVNYVAAGRDNAAENALAVAVVKWRERCAVYADQAPKTAHTRDWADLTLLLAAPDHPEDCADCAEALAAMDDDDREAALEVAASLTGAKR